MRVIDLETKSVQPQSRIYPYRVGVSVTIKANRSRQLQSPLQSSPNYMPFLICGDSFCCKYLMNLKPYASWVAYLIGLRTAIHLRGQTDRASVVSNSSYLPLLC